MPSPDELANKNPPLFSKATVLFLNDLHEYKDVADQKLLSYVGDKRFKVVATIASEKYDSDWFVLSRFSWNECRVMPWSELEGRRLADARGKTFFPNTFRGTPLSVLAPDAEMKRAYELISVDGKAVLQALKIVKLYLGCFADFQLISAVSAKPIRYPAFLDVISHGYWCRIYESRALLADGIDEFVNYRVQLEDAYKLQFLLSNKDPPLENASEYLFYLGNQFNRLDDPSRALQCYNRSLELDEFRNTLVSKNLLLAEIESRLPETRGKASFDSDQRPGVRAHVWATGGRAYLSFARMMKANGLPIPTVLTGMTVDLTFAIKGADTPVSGVMSDMGASTYRDDSDESWNAFAIYLPPGFTVPNAYPATLVEPMDDYGIRVLTAPPCDPYGPGWRVICVSRDAFASGGEEPRPVPFDPFHDQPIKLTSDRKGYYIRIKGVTPPVVAGRYFFKIALLKGELSYSIRVTPAGMSTERGWRPPRFLRLEDSPVMLVQGEVTPASISGTIRRTGHNQALQPLYEAGRIHANMTTRLDPYTSAKRPDLPTVDAIGYFSAAAQGHYEMEGLAPGVYDFYASAAGFPQVLIASGVSVLKGQSLHLDGYLKPGVVIRGDVFSKRKLAEEPWLETTCANIELYDGPTFTHIPDPSAGLISWSPSHWICRGKHNPFDGSNVSSRYYTHLGGHVSDSTAGSLDSGNTESMGNQAGKGTLTRGPRDVGPQQNWFVQGATTQPFSFQLGMKDEFGAPKDFDGMVPQLDATWTNGLTAGRYYVRAWVRGYDQSAADGSTFMEYSFDVMPNDGVREIKLPIDLRPIHRLKST
jgi:hypothetical protein